MSDPVHAVKDRVRADGHYVDEGSGDPVVCFHGEPTWSYLYRKMLPSLTAAGHRVVCPDYPGFGRSDKPTERGWYTYDRHVEHRGDARRGGRAVVLDEAPLIAFSDSDPVFPYPRAGQRFCDLIPGAGEQVRIEGAAHFLQEDRGEEIAGRIVEFTGGGSR